VIFRSAPSRRIVCADITEEKQATFAYPAFLVLGSRVPDPLTAAVLLSLKTAHPGRSGPGWAVLYAKVYAFANSALVTGEPLDSVQVAYLGTTHPSEQIVPGCACVRV
jgi:hypothetical protein